jgi:hypothetical protein
LNRGRLASKSDKETPKEKRSEIMKSVVMGIAVLALIVMTVLLSRRDSQTTGVTSLAPINHTAEAKFHDGANSNRGAAALEQNPQLTEAAFRDGLYEGRLDAEQCRPVHVTSGRWSRQEDRALFSDGYQLAYQRILAARRDENENAVSAGVVVISRYCRD